MQIDLSKAKIFWRVMNNFIISWLREKSELDLKFIPIPKYKFLLRIKVRVD
jgi:hypothetical protein